jgi:hypothetical protein
VGGLAGFVFGGLFTNDHMSGTISGSNSIELGGLLGYASASEINSTSAEGKMTGYNYVGGLVGEGEENVITGSSASADVRAKAEESAGAGGLVGFLLEAEIRKSSSSGSVTALGSTAYAGGLVGWSLGTIKLSSADSQVTGGIAGGLVGESENLVSQCFATGPVATGKGGMAGGLVGLDRPDVNLKGYEGRVLNSYASGGVKGGEAAEVGGLIGNVNHGIITDSYASGAVRGRSVAYLGGLVGDDSGGAYTDTYWDITSSGTRTGVGNLGKVGGIVGLTARKFRSGLPAGFDATIWNELSGFDKGLPYLLANPPQR